MTKLNESSSIEQQNTSCFVIFALLQLQMTLYVQRYYLHFPTLQTFPLIITSLWAHALTTGRPRLRQSPRKGPTKLTPHIALRDLTYFRMNELAGKNSPFLASQHWKKKKKKENKRNDSSILVYELTKINAVSRTIRICTTTFNTPTLFLSSPANKRTEDTKINAKNLTLTKKPLAN